MSNGFATLFKRDIIAGVRRPVDALSSVLFFVMVITLFPLGISSDQDVLASIGPGLIWVSALLSIMLSLNRLFQSDYEDGSLEQLLLAPQSLTVLMLARLTSFWCISALPLICISPLLGILLALDGATIKALMLSLMLGTPVLCAIGAIGAALSTGVKNNGVLMVLMVLPLYIPVLIFGTASVMAASLNQPAEGLLAIQGALLLLSASLSPMAIGASLKITVGE